MLATFIVLTIPVQCRHNRKGRRFFFSLSLYLVWFDRSTTIQYSHFQHFHMILSLWLIIPGICRSHKKRHLPCLYAFLFYRKSTTIGFEYLISKERLLSRIKCVVQCDWHLQFKFNGVLCWAFWRRVRRWINDKKKIWKIDISFQ